MFALRLAAIQMCAQREHAAAQFLLNSMAMPAREKNRQESMLLRSRSSRHLALDFIRLRAHKF
jgi:hypothetical protein